MPLFMFISGFLAYGKEVNLQKKFFSLVIPFIVWYQISYLILIYFGHPHTDYFAYLLELYYSAEQGLWFLWILFLNFILLKQVKKYINFTTPYINIVMLFCVNILLQFIPYDYFGINLLKSYFLYFAVGYLISHYSIHLPKSNFLKTIVALSFIFLGSYHVFAQLPSWISEYLLAFLGIGTTFAIVTWLPKNISSALALLGTYTMEVYVIHQMVIWGFGTGIWQIISATIITICTSLAIAYFVKKSHLLNRVFFGSR